MGCCISTNVVRKELLDKFLNYNIIDKKYGIIVGTYLDGNEKSNTLISQGICIGYNNNKINKVVFGIIHRHGNGTVELYFENNIKLIISKESNDQLKMILTFNGSNIEKYIEHDIIKNYKIINTNSEYINLLFDLINK